MKEMKESVQDMKQMKEVLQELVTQNKAMEEMILSIYKSHVSKKEAGASGEDSTIEETAISSI